MLAQTGMARRTPIRTMFGTLRHRSWPFLSKAKPFVFDCFPLKKIKMVMSP
jgi:hypothetical protein